ncbi:hypothetical protein [Rhodococcus sp. NBC_00294]|uniref:hypothetical protein n=1 Tax=Rhodococcus sp. NBC_00294 TaxID=2976004 RepID=UPI002E2D5695|nr:hypothetical protein [Rhodococcus sp. NBC_00294]
MPVPDWLPYATLAASAVAAGGAGWAVSTTRMHLTRETRRARELRTIRAELTHDSGRQAVETSLIRDQVTERYQELSVALTTFQRVWIDAVRRRTAPDATALPPSADDLQADVDAAYQELLRISTITVVVARQRVAPLLEMLMSLDLRVLVPYSTTGAMPGPAVERLNREHGFLIEIQRLLRDAMRADLGLLDANDLGLLIMDTKRVVDTLSPDRRSIGFGATERRMVEYLAEFGVRVLAGGNERDYTMEADRFAFYQAKDPALAGAVEAILALYGAELSLAVHAGLDEQARLPVLQRVVASLECGFRDRDGILLPDGTTVYAFRPGR